MQGCRALRHLLTYCVTLQQGPCGICSMVRTDFRAPAATPPQQEPSGIGSMIALPDGGGISRFLESLMMCLRAPLRAQGFWPTHECSAAGHLRLLLTYCMTLQQWPCGICSIVRTDFWAPAAALPQQEPCGIVSMIALPEGGGISRILESQMMCLRAPLRAQGFWPTHECSAAGH